MLLAAILFVSLFSFAQQPAAIQSSPQPPQMTLPLMLRKLHTTARILHITAHPDDEDGPMLALESWGKGATVMLLTLNRGEGGQNITGSELFDRLGILRTLELLEADRYYGVQQRFTRAADFGFSKSAQESLEKWGDAPLADVVRVIREFQPDVIVSRFQGAPRDGHGHHQASGIIAREAFRAAADPQRFPEQLKEGLHPWQAKKLYVDNVHEDEDWTLKLETSAVDPLLGESYFQLARTGLRHQLSQGAGNWQIPGGEHYSYYKLVDTAMPNYHPQHEQDFMDGIDTSLEAALPSSVNPEIRVWLRGVESEISKTETASLTSEAAVLSSLDSAEKGLDHAIVNLPVTPNRLRTAFPVFAEKREQLRDAINLVAGVELEADAPASGNLSLPQIRDGRFDLQVTFRNRGSIPLRLDSIGSGFLGSGDGNVLVKPGATLQKGIDTFVPGNAGPSQPYFHRSSENEAVYRIAEPKFATLPFAPPTLTAYATYQVDGVENTITTTAETTFKLNGTLAHMPLSIASNFSVRVAPTSQIVPLSSSASPETNVVVTNNLRASEYSLGMTRGELKLDVPSGWRAQPSSTRLYFTAAGQQRQVHFKLFPTVLSQTQIDVRAVFTSASGNYGGADELIGRPDIGYAYYYQPAVQKISVVDVKTVPGLKVGYIMGAGDDIPEALRQLGVAVQLISPEELAAGDLSRYGTIIVGIRAYDTRADLRNHNSRLLDFVSRGGTLMVQYNSGVADFNAGNFTPYPASLGRDRVTVEESPVTLLAPDDPVFHFPNEITPQDFAGWVQERGLYFMSSWDNHFQPLISCHDPGEPPLGGGLLAARYGKGLYIYNAYAFFRQLPTGVPGAVRLYVNLLSAGHEPAAKAAASKSRSASEPAGMGFKGPQNLPAVSSFSSK